MPKLIPFRLVLGVEGKRYKFLSVFVGKDNSVYVHPYRPEGEPWYTTGIQAAEGASGLKIDFDAFAPSAMDLQKLTLHPDGAIHLKCRSGERFRKVRGPAGEDQGISGYPREPEKLDSIRGHEYFCRQTKEGDFDASNDRPLFASADSSLPPCRGTGPSVGLQPRGSPSRVPGLPGSRSAEPCEFGKLVRCPLLAEWGSR